ncbi:MAG: hypothetical protein FIO02_10630 [Nitrosopumilales archaeon]|nr:hypothetical protein [Nitrosopumilales archaeon]
MQTNQEPMSGAGGSFPSSISFKLILEATLVSSISIRHVVVLKRRMSDPRLKNSEFDQRLRSSGTD